MPTAFLTGATGFVGSEIALKLLDAGWDVTATRRATSKLGILEGRNVQWVQAPLHDADALTEVMPEGIDGVFHCAGNTTFWKREYDDQFRDNVIATRAMVAASLRRKAGRFILTSSGAAYGRHDEPLHEGMTSKASLSPIVYDRTKWQAECEVREAIHEGLQAVILNPGGVVGPRDTNFTPMLLMAAQGKLPGAMPAKTSFCHVGALADAHLAAYDRGVIGDNYILGGPNDSQLALAQAVARAAGAEPPTREIPPWLMGTIGGAVERVSELMHKRPAFTRATVDTMGHCWFMDSSKAIRELGYEPPSLDEIAEELVAWMRSEGMLR